MNYRKVTENIKRLKPKEVITFLALLQKTDYNTYKSEVKLETLSTVTGFDYRTIRRHIKALNDKGLITIHRRKIKGLQGIYDRNSYTVSTEHYDLIDIQGLLELPLKDNLKGFLAILKALCIDGTNKCQFTIERIAEETGMDSKSVYRYLSELEKTNQIKRKKDTIKIINCSIFLTVNLNQFRIVENIYHEILTDYDYRERKVAN